MPKLAVLAMLAACRFNFDSAAHGDGGGSSGDANGDGSPIDGGFVAHAETYIKASNTEASDQFGQSVALSADGNTLAVGAIHEASNATGIDGNQADNSLSHAGAVYVYARSGSSWIQQAYVKASNPDANDDFGWAVALSADGNTLAVGAFGEASSSAGINGNQLDNTAGTSGAAYVFTRAGTTWTQQAYVKASNPNANDFYGWTVALAADGNTLAVGAVTEASSATGIGGNQLDNTAAGAGAVYVYTRAGTTWTQQAYVKASNTNTNDYFGWVVALSADGNTLAVSADQEASNATGIGGNQLDNSVVGAGAVYVFTRAGTTWSQQAYVKASNTAAADTFGSSLALAGDGNTLVVGAAVEGSAATGLGGNQADNSAANAGAVYLFTRAGTTWTQQAYVKASNTGAGDGFGGNVAVSADGHTIAVAAAAEDSSATGTNGTQADEAAMDSGAVYIFAGASMATMQTAYVKASNTGTTDAFGHGVALSTDGATLAVSAAVEDGAATGIGGNQADNTAVDSGAVYVIE